MKAERNKPFDGDSMTMKRDSTILTTRQCDSMYYMLNEGQSALSGTESTDPEA
jgi:hypothetical protein